MKLKLFLIAASAMALASCSSDEVVKSNEDANAIKFSVVADNASRASDYYCNKSLPGDFYVSAAVGGNEYFDLEHYTQSGDTYVNADDLRYWPSQEITFVAAKNFEDGTFNFGATGETTFKMTVEKFAKDQKDFIFGVTKATRTAKDATSEEKAAANYSDGVANINFRHALSQIVFQAKNTNENIFVEINQIKVCNVNSKGTYTITANAETGYAVTNDTYIDCTQTSTTDPVDATVYQEGGRGTWGTTPNTLAYFDTEVFTSKTISGKVIDGKVKGDGKVVNLTNDRFVTTEDPTNHDASANHTHSLLLIPQTITPWAGGEQVVDGAGNPKLAADKGAYFLVYCRIRNVAAGNGTEATGTDVYLWGKDNYEAIAVPVNAITWEQGKKYIYTLNFTDNGHGGFDPDNGDEVLIPIEFTVSVDDFAEVTPGQEIAID